MNDWPAWLLWLMAWGGLSFGASAYFRIKAHEKDHAKRDGDKTWIPL